MKKTLLTVGLLALGTAALAGNWSTLNGSTKKLAGALQGEFDDGVMGVRSFLPGYGYQISISDPIAMYAPKTAADKIGGIVKQMAPSIKGLDKTEWLSVTYKGQDKNFTEYELLIRWRAGKLERWLNGKAF